MKHYKNNPPCQPDRKILQSQYERTDFSSQEWWSKMFSNLEAEAAILPIEKETVLKKIIPETMFKIIKHIFDIKVEEVIKYTSEQKHLPDPHDEKSIIDSKIIKKESKSPDSIRDTEIQAFSQSIQSIQQESVVQTKEHEKNPYLKFMKQTPDEARIWREKPEPDFKHMPLVQRVAIRTDRIIKGFCKWVRDLGGETSQIDEECMYKMFEVGFDTHASRGISKRLKEMPSVPMAVAIAKDICNMSTEAVLQKYLLSDVKMEDLSSRTIAFQKTLPEKLSFTPPKNNTRNRWLVCQNVPKEISTMSAVWEGILNLKSVQAYCDWLRSHSELSKPAYLVNAGLFDLGTILPDIVSIDTQELLSIK